MCPSVLNKTKLNTNKHKAESVFQPYKVIQYFLLLSREGSTVPIMRQIMGRQSHLQGCVMGRAIFPTAFKGWLVVLGLTAL